MAENLSLKADILLVLVTVLAAAGWVFSMFALQGLPPLLFVGVRFLLAGLLLVVVGRHQLRLFDVRGWSRSALTGIVMGVAMVCWIEGLNHTDNIGVGAFITSLGSILAPFIGWVLFRTRVFVMTWFAAAVAVTGMACLFLGNGLGFTPADLLFFASAIGFSLNFNLNSRFAARIPVLPLTAVQLIVVGVLNLAVSAIGESWALSPGWKTIGWLTLSILVATSLRFSIQFKAQGLTSVSHAAIIMTLEPVWTALVAVVWLGTAMSHTQGLGCTLIFGALLVNRGDSIAKLVRRQREVAARPFR